MANVGYGGYKKQNKSKYGSKKTIVDSIKFDSIKESKRYLELKQRQESGYISFLELQPKYILQDKYRDKTGKMIRAITYSADFKYFCNEEGIEIVEDVKGSPKFLDPVYVIKKKILLYKYPDIEFREVYDVTI